MALRLDRSSAMSSSWNGRPGKATAGGPTLATSRPAVDPTRMSLAARTTPPMVCSAAWLTGRPLACCAAAIDSTTATGLVSLTGWTSAA
eukprot:5805048-Alexandrium_andersonii.AAC.1